ncbi:MAG: BrnT family toxin [Oribacterium sp.]|jgi:uncharacterized DUF497 family protein|nr:BrnT family toxin [Oribacterium sp.]
MPDRYYTYGSYSFIWDEDKNKLNIKKHKIDFETASLVFSDDLRIEFEDAKHSEDEPRYDTIGMVMDVFFVVYCDRGSEDDSRIRIISARYATKEEINLYNDLREGRF